MRVLLLFRGSAGCGKSSFIKVHNLKQYTLSADDIRLQMQSPVLRPDGSLCISPKNDKDVWKILFNLLEKRMQKGEFTVIDAVNSKTSEISRYKEFADKYRYRMYIVDMTDIPIDEVKKRNANRLPEYKRVPDKGIDKIYARFATQKVPSGIKVIKPEELDTILYKPMDLSGYKKIHVIGDIHSSFSALKEYLCRQFLETNPIALSDDIDIEKCKETGVIGKYKGEQITSSNLSKLMFDDELYVFTGDYLDRGIEPIETLKFLLSIYKLPNVILLEGNHECFHKDTEVLTENGWKLIKDVDINTDYVAQFNLNSNRISYVKPLDKVKSYAEDLICFEGNNMKQIVTFNHDVVYKGQKIKAKDLLSCEDLIENMFPYYGWHTEKDFDITDDILRLLVWIVADGTLINYEKYTNNSKKRIIQFHFSRDRKIKDLKELLEKMEIEYTFNEGKSDPKPNRKQDYFIRIYGDTARYYHDILLNKTKHYPEFFKKLSRRQAIIVIDELLKTDAHYRSSLGITWSCVEKQDIDTIQEMCIKNNISFTYKLIENNGFKSGNIYTATIKPYSQYAKKIIPEIVKYNDDVYCLTMPEGTLVTRIDGKVAFSGNCYARNYSHNIDDYNRNFKETTLPSLNKAVASGEIKKSDMRQLCRKFGQVCYFTYGDKKVLVSHGGLSSMKDNLIYISTEQIIRGVGDYEDYLECAKAFEKSTDENTYQISGHRNVTNVPVQATDRCFNLEGKVEFGGHLRVVTLDENGFQTHEIKNNVFREQEEVSEVTLSKEDLTNDDVVKQLRNNPFVKEKEMGNISSFNFTRDAFYKKHWDEQTTKARGLFIDTRDNSIKLRGYSKFWNVNEMDATKILNLQGTLSFPVTAYVKENGFLGLISYNKDTDDLMFATKSVVDYASQEGDLVNVFKDLYMELSTQEEKQNLLDFVKSNNKTVICECVHQEKDPHIIEYPTNRIYLLDIISNDFEGKKEEYKNLQIAAKSFGLICKEKAFTFDNWEDFYGWYLEVTDEDYQYNGRNIEGFVIEDSAGFMVKLKLAYYNFWKMMRGITHSVLKRGFIKNTASLYNAEANYFYGWLREHRDKYTHKDENGKTVPNDVSIIELRKRFLHDMEIKNNG